MNPTRRRILNLWRKLPAKTFSLNDIRKALKGKKQQNPKYKAALDEMVAHGDLLAKGNGYRLNPKAPVEEERKKAKKGARVKGMWKGAGEGASETESVDADEAAGRDSPYGRGKEQALVGTYSAHPNEFGFVEIPDAREDLFVPPKHIGGALDGDTVRVELLKSRDRGRGPSARVVEVVRRGRNKLHGRLVSEYGQMWVVPLNVKMPMVFIETPPAKAIPNEALVEVRITDYPTRHDEAPHGVIGQVIGSGQQSPGDVVSLIISDFGLQTGFSPTCMKEAQALPGQPTDDADSGREDMRKLNFITIDGEDARDFDDAVCLETLPKGRMRLLVAIADVAAYVKRGSAVDRDAYERGTSTYFPDRVLPMLPERLSNDLCSLRPNESRHTMTCEMELNGKGERVGYRIYPGIIESKARLTYTRVQRLFEEGDAGNAAGKDIEAPIADMLARMRSLAETLRKNRQRRGALDFVLPEARFDLDKSGHPADLRMTLPTEATRLIEQFMLEANETVAGHCAQHKLPVLYRVHDPPPSDQLVTLAQTLWNFGIESRELRLDSPGAIGRLLKQAAGHPQREQVELAVLKSMSQARYRERNDGHFALAAENYAHFTSPIRRYPDLIVHRALKASLADGGKVSALPADTGLHLSARERNAGEAEGRVIRLYKVLYMESKMGESFPAIVNGVSDRGAWVGLRDLPIEGLVPLDLMDGGGMRHDRKRNLLVARGRRRNIGQGERITVRLVRADRLAQELEFGWVSGEWKAQAEE